MPRRRYTAPGFVAAIASMGALLAGAPAQATPGSEILERARSWVESGVGYQAGGTFTNQYGTYRTDCSGYVSMALGLPTSYTTGTLVDVSYPIAKDALEPGDIINNPAEGPSGHVVLFAGWADDAQTRYYAYEESPSGGAHFSEIPYPYWPGYGTFTPRRYTGTTSNSKPPIDIPEQPEKVLPDSPEPDAPPPLVDGVLVRHDGRLYRMAGGAALPTPRSDDPVRKLTDAEFAELAEQPADGTFLKTDDGERFVVAGGAPIYVPRDSLETPDPVIVKQTVIDEAGESSPLNDQPADGTVVKTDSGEHYVFAGGAPIHMTTAWRKALRPRPTATTVPELAIDLAGGYGAWSHVRKFPADQTLIKSGASVYRIENGVPVPHHGVRGVPVDPAALDNAGGEGPWSHLVSVG